MKPVRVNEVSLINLKKTLGSQTITFYGTTYFAAARSAMALRIFKFTKFSLLLTKLESYPVRNSFVS